MLVLHVIMNMIQRHQFSYCGTKFLQAKVNSYVAILCIHFNNPFDASGTR